MLQAAFRPDGRTIVLAGDDSIRTFDIAEAIVPGHWFQKGATSVASGPHGIWVTGTKRGEGTIWTNEGRRKGFPIPHEEDLDVVAFWDDGGLIATGGRDKTVRFSDSEGRPLGMPILQSHWPMVMAFSRPGDRILVGCVDNKTRMFDVATRRKIGKTLVHPKENASGGGICLVATLDDANVAISVSRDGTVQRMRLDTGEPVGVPWQYPEREPAKNLKPNQSQLSWSWAAISPDRRVLMVVAGGTVHLSDAATGQDGPAPFGREIKSAVFLPDGKTILTGGNDGMARLWDMSQVLPIGPAMTPARTVEQVGSAMTHSQAVMQMVASPDGQTVLTIDLGGHAQLWDLATRKPIGPVRLHDLKATPPVFSDDGRWLALIHESVEMVPVTVPVADDLDSLLSWLRLRTGVELKDQTGFDLVNAKVGQKVESPTSEADWHSRMASKCEIRDEDEAVLWHLDRLARLRPENGDVQARLANLSTRMGRKDSASAAEARAKALATPR